MIQDVWDFRGGFSKFVTSRWCYIWIIIPLYCIITVWSAHNPNFSDKFAEIHNFNRLLRFLFKQANSEFRRWKMWIWTFFLKIRNDFTEIYLSKMNLCVWFVLWAHLSKICLKENKFKSSSELRQIQFQKFSEPKSICGMSVMSRLSFY